MEKKRSYMPYDEKNQDIKQKQYCNYFNKDFKNSPHQKNLKKKKEGSLIFWNWREVKVRVNLGKIVIN